jgi:excisionase family DNA binding protein
MTKVERLLVKPAEACVMLGIGRTSLAQLIESGEIPVVRMGTGICRIPLAALRKIAASASTESDGDGGAVA